MDPTPSTDRPPRVTSGGAAAAGGFRFQAQLGAFFALNILSQHSVLSRELELDNALPLWMRFETEAPVDDILIATSSGGFIAIQAKTSLNLSDESASEFAKTMLQLVRHWLVCQNGRGDRLWDRSLNPQCDRLVLAVGPSAPASIRIRLPEVLRLCAQFGSAPLTQEQSQDLKVFQQCAEMAWTGTTTEPWTPDIICTLARLIRVITFDPGGADSYLMEEIATNVAAQGQSQALLTALPDLCLQWITERSGADLPTLRQALAQKQVGLKAPPIYDQDIRSLKEHSEETAHALKRYESIEQSAGKIRIPRECQNAVLAAAEQGSLLIIGEPGAGKSAVINTLARELRRRGDVVELAVDRYSANDLDGLRIELGLQNDLIKVFEAWDGSTPGWLIIDALDATRGGKREGAFRLLIERVLALKGRWQVVASIRAFDLRMGKRFRELFPGQPLDENYRNRDFPTVQHVLVPPWSQAEFNLVLTQAPELGQALEDAPAKLRQLAEVPFNTRLIIELLQSGVVANTLCNLANQAQLLHRYWESRITDLGSAAEACLSFVVHRMIEARTLRVLATDVAGHSPEALDTLCIHAVLIRVENDRYVQFRHHLLFDYAASRLLLDMDGIVSGRTKFPKSDAKGLILAPALGFLLQELWVPETGHDRYWTAVKQIVGDSQGDPILRSVASRLSAELPETRTDALALAQDIDSDKAPAIAVLRHVATALAIRLEDDSKAALAPWLALVGELVRDVQHISSELRFLVYQLLKAKPQELTELGKAARAMLGNAFDHEIPTASLIPFVIDTFSTDPIASQALLVRIFDPNRFAKHGWKDVPALCLRIEQLASKAPDFVAQIYAKTYAHSVDSNNVTHIGNSRILSLTSNTRQDYEAAWYALSRFFPKFLSSHPVEAAKALVGAVEAYVARNRFAPKEQNVITCTFNDRTLRLKPDRSYMWASDPEAQYDQDGQKLVAAFATAFTTLPEDTALAVTKQLVSTAMSAIIWSRLFLAVVRHGGESLIDFLWPIAARKDWLMQPDTSKDAIDVVVSGYARRSIAEKEAFERSALVFDISELEPTLTLISGTLGFSDKLEAKRRLLTRLFSGIGMEQLVTEEAREYLASLPPQAHQSNERLYSVDTIWEERVTIGIFDQIPDRDRDIPANATIMTAIEKARAYFGLESEQSSKPEIETWKGLSILESVAQCLVAPDLNLDLRCLGEGTIGQGCACLAKDQHLVLDKLDPAERFVALLKIAVHSDAPSVDGNTEARFEQSPSWGSPAPRVDAAVAALDACIQRPDLYPLLRNYIDRLLDDAHPATRLQAATHLVRLWDIDRPGFWSRLSHRLHHESNFGVLRYIFDLLRRILRTDPVQTEEQLLAILTRFSNTSNEWRLAKLTAPLFTDLAVAYSSLAAQDILNHWIKEPVVYKEPLSVIVVALRDAVALGLQPGEAGDSKMRHRAQTLFHSIVEAINAHFKSYDLNAEIPDDQVEALRACMVLLDTAGMQLYLGVSQTKGGTDSLSDAGCTTFLKEMTSTIKLLGETPQPQTVYHLMQLIEILVPYGPSQAFDLTAHAIRAGGSQSGYQYESLGADLLVRLIGTFLADHKDIFADEDRRQALVGCLEIFMEAGWPAARRLLYRLPEFFQ